MIIEFDVLFLFRLVLDEDEILLYSFVVAYCLLLLLVVVIFAEVILTFYERFLRFLACLCSVFLVHSFFTSGSPREQKKCEHCLG
jgi:hypothetical protein